MSAAGISESWSTSDRDAPGTGGRGRAPRRWFIAATAALLLVGALETESAAQTRAQEILLEWVFDTVVLGGSYHDFGAGLDDDLGWGGGVTMEFGLAFPGRLSGLDGLETSLGARGSAVTKRGGLTIDDTVVEGVPGLRGTFLAARYRFSSGRWFVYPLVGVSFMELRARDGSASASARPALLLGAGVDVTTKEMWSPDQTFKLALLVRSEVVYEKLDFEPAATGLDGGMITAGVYFVAKWGFMDAFDDLKEAF